MQCQVVNGIDADLVNSSQVAVATQTDIATHSGFHSKSDGDSLTLKGKRGMKLNGLIEGTPIEWKLDTGAINTFITEDVYYSILPEQRPVLERAKKKFETASGDYLPVVGTSKMVLTFGDVSVVFRVFVGGVRHNLLGLDFITQFQCQWDFNSDSCVLSGLPTGPCDTGDGSCNVVCDDDSVVPAQHEAVIRATLDTGINLGDGLLVPLKTFVHSYGLVIARVLVSSDTDNKEVYVRVFNPYNRDIVVRKHSVMAVFEPVNFISSRIPVEEVCNIGCGSKNDEVPDFLRNVFKDGCEHLDDEQIEKFKEFIVCRTKAFADPSKPVERAKLGKHFIKLQDEMPFKEAVRRVPIFKREIMDEEIRKLAEQGLIEKSVSPWSSALVLVQKKDKSWRLCVDYRKLNSRTIKDAYPIPRVADDLDSLAGSKWFSSLDLNMAYHQIPMHEDDKEKTAFATPRGGLYQYTVMPFGLCNAPATFQRVIEQALSGLQWRITVLYLDDIIVYSRDFEEHMENLNLVLDRLEEVNLKLKAKKCRFFQKEVSFLGHIVSEEGIKTDPSKTDAIENWRTPTNVSELRSFLGLAAYYRRFIQDFAKIAKCLHALTSKKSVWNWTSECDNAFRMLKEKLVSAPILGYPDINGGQFILDTDASNDAIGAVLSQVQDGREIVISYGSRTLNISEKNYCVTRKEMLALVYFVKHYKHYLLGREFLLRTDHGSLVWLHKFREPDGQIARWLQQLGPYWFRVEHRSGSRHGNADSVSRIPVCDSTCKQCKRNPNIDYERVQFNHINELRGNSDVVHCDVLCLDVLFSDDTAHMCEPVLPVSRTRKQRKANRPPRAAGRKQPSMSLTSDNVQKEQRNDEGMKHIIKWLQDGQKPPFSALSAANAECKFLYSRWELLVLDKGVLCIRWITGNKEVLKVCLPKSYRDTALWYAHDAQTAGHLGIKRTLFKLHNSCYYWRKMRQCVQDYVSSCDVCEERKQPKRKKRAVMKTHLSGEPCERIAVDITGPFPKSDNGYSYLLVVSDYFTKFMEMYPLVNIEAETVSEVIFKGWIKRYGCPGVIHSDQGAQFESELFQGLCRLFQIDKTRTTPYQPRSDGLVERLNRTIKDMLSKYLSANQTNWDRFIDGLVLAYNTTPHESTNISPYRMMFGREAKLPLDLLTETNNESELCERSEAEYVRELRENLDSLHKIARETLQKSSLRQKSDYDRKVREVNYDVGDLVRRNQQKVAIGAKVKLGRHWTGPWTVIKRLSDVLYQIKHSRNSKPVIIHADNLKPYKGPVLLHRNIDVNCDAYTQPRCDESIISSEVPCDENSLQISSPTAPRNPAFPRSDDGHQTGPHSLPPIQTKTRCGRQGRVPRRYRE